MNYTVVVFGGVMTLSLIWYYFPIYGGVHWFTGPIKNIAFPAPDNVESMRNSNMNDAFLGRDKEKPEAAVEKNGVECIL